MGVYQGWGRLQRHDYDCDYDYTMITEDDYDYRLISVITIMITITHPWLRLQSWLLCITTGTNGLQY